MESGKVIDAEKWKLRSQRLEVFIQSSYSRYFTLIKIGVDGKGLSGERRLLVQIDAGNKIFIILIFKVFKFSIKIQFRPTQKFTPSKISTRQRKKFTEKHFSCKTSLSEILFNSKSAERKLRVCCAI
jgi:hypothetical protein